MYKRQAEIAPDSQTLTRLLVIYDRAHATDVASGENGGRRLQEYRIVRGLRSVEGTGNLVVLPGIASTQGAVLLLQGSDWRVRCLLYTSRCV